MLGLVDSAIVVIIVVEGELGIMEDNSVESLTEVGVESVLVRINRVVVLGFVEIAIVVIVVVEGELGTMEDIRVLVVVNLVVLVGIWENDEVVIEVPSVVLTGTVDEANRVDTLDTEFVVSVDVVSGVPIVDNVVDVAFVEETEVDIVCNKLVNGTEEVSVVVEVA